MLIDIGRPRPPWAEPPQARALGYKKAGLCVSMCQRNQTSEPYFSVVPAFPRDRPEPLNQADLGSFPGCFWLRCASQKQRVSQDRRKSGSSEMYGIRNDVYGSRFKRPQLSLCFSCGIHCPVDTKIPRGSNPSIKGLVSVYYL